MEGKIAEKKEIPIAEVVLNQKGFDYDVGIGFFCTFR